MELVKGVPITRYCDEHRLTPRRRLELFVLVCQAVQHAHQKGVIHRDLKPTNVLVAPHDGRPVPTVIDFGVAKAAGQRLTDKTLFTEFGAVVGTPEYMSPEQAELNQLDIDTRSDIYSLGVLLYELLTGTTPVTHQRVKDVAILELLWIIREDEPPRPSTRLSTLGQAAETVSANRGSEPWKLTALVRGELDWIVMKALEKDRDRRYESASALAADIERYLNDEPVHACPPSAGYRLRKFVRRNRGKVAVAGVGLAVLMLGVAGLVGALVAVDAERRQKKEALDQLTRQQDETSKALAAQSRTLKHAGLLLEAMSNDFVDAVLLRQPEFGEAEKAFFRQFAGLVDGLAREHPDTREAWIIQSDQYWFLGRVREALGEFKEAEAAFLASRAARRRLLADAPDDFRSRRGMAMIQVELGGLYLHADRLPEAEAALREAIPLATALVADYPNASDAYWYLVSAQFKLGLLLRETGRPAEAEAAHRAALKQVPQDHIPSERFPRMVAQIHDELGVLLDQSGRSKEAEAAFRASLAVRQKRVADAPRDVTARAQLADSHIKLGTLFARSGRQSDAEAGFREGEKRYRQLVGEFPLVVQYKVGLAWALGKVGSQLTGSDPREAESKLREALALRRRLADDVPDAPGYRQALALAHRDLSVVLRETDRLPDAETELRAAVGLLTPLAAGPAGTPDLRFKLAGIHTSLGVVLQEQHRMDQAEAAHREAVAVYATLGDQIAAIPEYAIDAGGASCNLANVLRATGRPAEALEWYDRAAVALEPAANAVPESGQARLYLRNTLWGRSRARSEVNRHPEALADIDRAVELTAPGGGRVPLQIQRAFLLVRAGDPARAAQAVEEVMAAGQWPAWVSHHAARVLALSAAAVKNDAPVRERHAARAVELLRRARAQGYFGPAGRVEQLKTEADLAGLRDRLDFRKFMEEVEASTPRKAPPKP
jgi:tetratricopeptide (TPR) repeat protein